MQMSYFLQNAKDTNANYAEVFSSSVLKKKKKQNASNSKISSWCKCSSTFPFSFHQTKSCLCSGTPCPKAQQRLSAFPHTSLSAWRGGGTPAPTSPNSPTPMLVFRLAAVMAWAGTSPASNLPLRETHTLSLCRHPSHVGFPATFLAWGPCFHHRVMVHGYSVYVVWWKKRICCLKENFTRASSGKNGLYHMRNEGAEALAVIKSQPTLSAE